MPQIKAKGTARLFKNPILDLLTRTHPALIVAMYVPLCAWLLHYYYTHINASLGVTVGLFLVGFFSWTLAEYFLHRFIFHWINDSAFGRRFHYMVHGVHHEYPKDRSRLVMPPLPSIGIAITFFTLFWVLLHHAAYAFFSGFVIGYLGYAIVHYVIHALRPPNNALKFLWDHHNLHHYRSPDRAFGVSSPLWDVVFGTMPRKDQKAKPSSPAIARGGEA